MNFIQGALMKEIFKQLPPKYGSKYAVSNLGRLRITTKNNVKYRTGSLTNHRHTSYVKVSLSHAGTEYTENMHRLVAEMFIPNPDDKPIVNHIDKDGTNNKVTNLEWCTHQENMQHSADTKSKVDQTQITKNRLDTLSNNTFISHRDKIGTDFNGRLMIGLQYKLNKSKVFKWIGIFECTRCNSEFTAHMQDTLASFNEGKVQHCRGCSISIAKKMKI